MHWVKDGLGAAFANQVWLVKTALRGKVHVAPVSWLSPAGRDPVMVVMALRSTSLTLKVIWKADTTIELLPVSVGVTGGNLVYADSLPKDEREAMFIKLWDELIARPKALQLKAEFEYSMVCPGTHELILLRVTEACRMLSLIQKKEETPVSLMMHGVSSCGKAFGYFCWE